MRRQSIQLAQAPRVRPIFWWLLGGAVVMFALSRSRTVQTVAEKAKEKVKETFRELVTLDRLRRAMPDLPLARAQEVIEHLILALDEAEINTPARLAAFLAQAGHESGNFRFMTELASGTAYENREDLGNTEPGDGPRYRGRGPLQLTGRANYRAFTRDVGKRNGIDFEANPDLVATDEWGFKSAAWYWNKRNLNRYADTGDFYAITYRIQGACGNYADRVRRYNVAKQALGVDLPMNTTFQWYDPDTRKYYPRTCCTRADGRGVICAVGTT